MDELAKLRAEIEELKRSTEAAQRAKDMFLSAVSHELRSPLSTMLMHAQLLKSGELGPEDLKKTGEAIERATQKQVQLIDDLLDAARIVSGNFPVNLARITLAETIRAAVEVATPEAKRKNVEVRANIEAVGTAMADPVRVAMVVRIVMSNAVRFSPRGGSVDVTLKKQDHSAVLVVKDSGPGVDDAWRERLFDRFTHPELTRPKAQGGAGMGLAVAHHIIARHRGSIELVESTPTGSTFKVTFPLEHA